MAEMYWSMEVDERSKAGLFLGMQYPSEISGVTNSDFLRTAINARRETTDPAVSVYPARWKRTSNALQMKEDLAHRFPQRRLFRRREKAQ